MNRQRRPPMKKAATAGTLLSQFLQQSGLAGKLHTYEAFLVWDEVVGPQIAAHAKPARIRDGVLEVRVDQAVWMQQLQLMKPKILTRLNERLGNQAIKDIFWRRGKIEPVLAAPTEPDRRRPPPLPAEETARIEAVVAPLSDPELRQRLQHFLVRQAQLDLSRRKD
jgi:predicted nucleic acid-binding Zn ribbon protein